MRLLLVQETLELWISHGRSTSKTVVSIKVLVYAHLRQKERKERISVDSPCSTRSTSTKLNHFLKRKVESSSQKTFYPNHFYLEKASPFEWVIASMAFVTFRASSGVTALSSKNSCLARSLACSKRFYSFSYNYSYNYRMTTTELQLQKTTTTSCDNLLLNIRGTFWTSSKMTAATRPSDTNNY